MFEINTTRFGAPVRQRNASTKARTDRPTIEHQTPDTFTVRTSRFGSFDEYNVRFLRSDDKVFADCDCEAGHNGFPCYHAMAAYDTVYAAGLTKQGQNILNRQSVAGLGFVGVKAPQGQVVHLNAGQVFEAIVPVKLTVEKQ